MTVLADHISVRGRFARSANLERDAGQAEPLDGYVVTARALDAVERVASTAANGHAGGAWSLTGPFGSGKSSFALLLDAAFGPPTATRETAWDLIAQASPSVAKLVRQAHQRHRTQETGFHRGLVTANREPLNHTVLRALHLGVRRTYGNIPSVRRFREAATLRGALEDAAASDPRRTGPSSPALVEIARCLAEEAPLLLIIDEFGKNLEAIGDGRGADPYLLQLLAEAGQGSGLPIFVLTLQHLSFEDHLARRRRSAASRMGQGTQGRFEDIAYVESARADPGSDRNRLRASTTDRLQCSDRSLGPCPCREDAVLGNRRSRRSGSGRLVLSAASSGCDGAARAVQPIRTARTHPVLVPGQPGADERGVLPGRHRRLPGRGPLPSVGLEAVYDYFVAGGASAAMSASRASRWIEIAVRLRDAHGLSRRQARLAKAIALLNLVSTTGTIRASSQRACPRPMPTRSILWPPSKGPVSSSTGTSPTSTGSGRAPTSTSVALSTPLTGRCNDSLSSRSCRTWTGLCRRSQHATAQSATSSGCFERRYVGGGEHVTVTPPGAFSEYDGQVLLMVGAHPTVPALAQTATDGKPIVAAIPASVNALDGAAREVAAVAMVLEDSAVKADWVARRELGERLAETRAALDHAISATFSADACRWVLLDGSGGRVLRAGRGSAALSAAADLAYPSTPMVRNEMLNRTELTSQGAKARRLLLEAMIEHGSEPNLGLDGYGPEVAMYRAFLEWTGLHGRDARGEVMAFRKPTEPSLRPAWEVLERELNRARTRRINLEDIRAALLLPPIGMKAAVIPVFVTAALLAFSDEIAIYEHGTFKPLLTRSCRRDWSATLDTSRSNTSPTRREPAGRSLPRLPSASGCGRVSQAPGGQRARPSSAIWSLGSGVLIATRGRRDISSRLH